MSTRQLLQDIYVGKKPSVEELSVCLQCSETEEAVLYELADQKRKESVGDAIYLRGIIEFSNYCTEDCFYCGIRASNEHPHRYRISTEEIIAVCKTMEPSGQSTVVLQSGEDPYYSKEVMGEILAKIKQETTLAITVSAGERDKDTYTYWKEKGMDRYLLRFETSDPKLYADCHPEGSLEKRLHCLSTLQEIGVQAGSGFLIGLPGETYEKLASDLLFCTGYTLDMIGVGPYIAHPDTPFKDKPNPFPQAVFFKVIALLRLLNPRAHIPATTAFDAIHPNGRNLCLLRGANVFMPNATPQKYRADYQLYPGKPCIDESGDDCARCVVNRLKRLGREIGTGPGHSFL